MYLGLALAAKLQANKSLLDVDTRLMCTTVATLELEFTPIDRDARNDRYQLAV